MFKLTSKITIESNRLNNDKRFIIPDFISNIEINSTWDTLMDTCKFELPKKVNWDGKVRLVDDGMGSNDEPILFERGDKVTIELGYDDEIHNMFEGFISDIDPDSPVKISCKDMMWYLGQIKLDATYMSLIDLVPAKFRTIGTYLTPLLAIVNGTLLSRGLKASFSFSILNENGVPETGSFVRTGAFRYPDKNKNTVAGLLEKLKSQYDIYFYIRNNVLHVDKGGRFKADGNLVKRIGVDLVEGLKKEAFRDQKVVWPFHFQRNVIDQNLTYINENKVPLKIEVSGSPSTTKADNAINRALTEVSNAVSGVLAQIPEGFLEIAQVQYSNLSQEDGDGAATVQRINFADLSKAELLLIAERIYNNMRYTGFEGTLTTFGQYPTKHGDIALLQDDRNPERNGAFMIKGVNTTFGVSGYRQQVSLERNVSSSILN